MSLRQDIVVAFTPPGIGVFLLHQVLNGAFTVPDYMGRNSLSNRNHLVIDHQNAVVAACVIVLHNHPVGNLAGLIVGNFSFFPGVNI